MQILKKYLLVFACVAFALVSCNTEEVQPTPQQTPNTIGSRLTDDILYAGDIVTPSVGTYSYQVAGNSNTSRTWLEVSDFGEGCSCYDPNGGCPRLIIKDINNNVILDTDCQSLIKYVRIPGKYFIVNIQGYGDAKIKVLNW